MESIDLKTKTSRRKAVKKIKFEPVVCPMDWPGPVPAAWNHEPLPEPEPVVNETVQLDETMYDEPEPILKKVSDVKVTCPCGAIVSKKSLSKHIKTDKHLKLIPGDNIL